MATPPLVSESPIRPQTNSLLDWDRIDTLMVGLESRAPKSGLEAVDGAAPDPQRQAQLQTLFETFANQCKKALVELKRSAKLSVMLIIVAVAFSIGGSVVMALVHSQKAMGGVLSVAGLAALATVLIRANGINRDIAMLELLPTKYQLAFTLATTSKQYDLVFRTFLEETTSLRKSAKG